MIVLLNFLLFRMMPGSPERVLLRNPNITPQVLEAARARWGLDKPVIPDQFVAYIASTRPGRPGLQLSSSAAGPCTDVVGERMGPTLILLSAWPRCWRSRWACSSAPGPAGAAAGRSTGSATA